MIETKKIAVVTYNRIGDGQYQNGVMRQNGIELYIAQNGHLSKWAADAGTDEERAQTRTAMAKRITGQVELADMDQIFLYVGSNGGEEAIRATRDLPKERITYVMCDCNAEAKRRMLKEMVNGEPNIRWCECGGRTTLAEIVKGLIGG